MRDPLKLVWEDAALQDLAEAAEFSAREARAVVDGMERMAQRGWSLGHPTDRPAILYWPVYPLGVL